MNTLKELVELRNYLEIEMENNSEEVNNAYRDIYAKIDSILVEVKKTCQLI